MRIFFDIETRSQCDIKKVGGVRYAMDPSTRVLVVTWAFEEGPVYCWSPRSVWSGDNDDIEELQGCIESRENLLVAHNAIFDFCVWNRFFEPRINPEQLRCSQAQAEAFVLEGSLGKACKALGLEEQKDQKGKALIKRLSDGNRPWDATDDELLAFREYARQDVAAMRALFQKTRPLLDQEWAHYTDTLRKNLRGVAVDLDYVRAAIDLDAAMREPLTADLRAITWTDGITLASHVKKNEWLEWAITQHPEGDALREALGGEVKSGEDKRKTLLKLVHPKSAIARFCRTLDEGSGVAAKKFEAMRRMAWEGRVYGQYVTNGAGQTGRESSRGIQQQNIVRDSLPCGLGQVSPVEDVQDCVVGRNGYDHPATVDDLYKLAEWYDMSPQDVLARTIRGTFMAGPGHMLVWGDSSQIEKRVTAWISGSAGGERVLDQFRAGRDIYRVTAADLFGGTYDDHPKGSETRQLGKAAALALDFAGGRGAMQRAAPKLTEARAQEIVDLYRSANPWLVEFWSALEAAAHSAIRYPGRAFRAGRVRYISSGGTLLCVLPSGRPLVYPECRWERRRIRRPWEDRAVTRNVLMRRSVEKGQIIRRELQRGHLVENCVQAAANDLLRYWQSKVSDHVVMTTHDELVLEVPEAETDAWVNRLENILLHGPEWAEGLPLASEVEWGTRYSK